MVQCRIYSCQEGYRIDEKKTMFENWAHTPHIHNTDWKKKKSRVSPTACTFHIKYAYFNKHIRHSTLNTCAMTTYGTRDSAARLIHAHMELSEKWSELTADRNVIVCFDYKFPNIFGVYVNIPRVNIEIILGLSSKSSYHSNKSI